MAITNATPNTATSMTTGQMAVFNATQTFASAVTATDEDILFTQHCVFSSGGTFNRCGVVFNLPHDMTNVRNKSCSYTSSKIRFASGGNWNKVALSTMTNCVVTGSGQSTLFPCLSGASAWNNVTLAQTGQVVFDTDANISAFNGVQVIDNNGGFWSESSNAIVAYGLAFSGTTPASMFVNNGTGQVKLWNSYTVLFARTRINAGKNNILYGATRNILTAADAKVAAWDKAQAVAYQATASGSGVVPEIIVETHRSTNTGGVGTIVYDDKLAGSGYSEILYKFGFGLVRNDVASHTALRLGTPSAQNGGTAVSIPVPLTADSYVSASEATAAAMDTVKFSKSGATVTVLAAATLDELYDWLHWRTRADIPSLTRPSVGGALVVSENATASGDTITLNGLNLAANAALSAGAKLARLVTAGTVTTNGNLSVAYTDAGGAYAKVAVSGLTSGSRVQVYNATTSTEIFNGVVAGTSLSLLAAYAGAETIRLRATYLSGLTCKAPYEASNTISANGVSFAVSQSDCPVYASYGIDGSAVTGFTADYVDDEVDLTVGANFYIKELFSWWMHNLTTESGVREFFGGITAVDEGNIQVNSAIINIRLDNLTATDVLALDNRRFFRTDGTRPVKNPTTGGGGVDVEWREKVLFVNDASIAAIKAKTDNLPASPAAVSDVQAVASAVSALTIPTAATTAAAVRVELAAELARMDAAVSSRSTLTAGDIPEGLTAAQVWGYGSRSLTVAPSSLTAADVWEYGTRSLTVATTTDLTPVLDAIGELSIPTASANASAVWSSGTRTLTVAAGMTPEQEAKLDDIAAKTVNLPQTPASSSEVSSVASAVAALDYPTAATLAAEIAPNLNATLTAARAAETVTRAALLP